MERRALSARSATESLAGILRPLFSERRNRLHLLRCAGGRDRAALDGNDPGAFPFRLQVAARDHSPATAARLPGGAERLSARTRTARAETAHRAHSTPAFLRADGGKDRAAEFRGAIA